ncbi:MAG TPA: Hsp20/alpha crystallin family protein [Myxococcaceae bacterium]|nr:Hsp20/alpha crystallin family protein [Myxococcaceae bacterium]
MATLTRWDPFRELSRLQNDLNRLFDDRGVTGRGTESFGWAPMVDVFEDAEGLTFKFEVPEVDPKDVQVNLEDGVLTVRGERKLEREDKRDNYHRIERSYGTFARSFTLPANVDPEKVTAETKNGVLRIFVPKRAEAKPKTITIKSN